MEFAFGQYKGYVLLLLFMLITAEIIWMLENGKACV